ncbi:MAG: fatty acid cis/trans isomerase [Desulfobulbaceae bacterium]|nr:fatty acid cis/trans isomerase [Desulfobulbaceae bacterium]
MNKYVSSIVILILVLALAGCRSAAPPTIMPKLSDEELSTLKRTGEKLDYQKDIQPILDRRCVVCHSCYNSPCQLKMTSFEGLARGATKSKVYDSSRLIPAKPTRLFIDAKTTPEWRKKHFADVTGGDNALGPDSFMFQLLDLKTCNPEIKGTYESEAEDLSCSQTDKELKSFIKKNPHAGMPFGFPEIKKEESFALKAWLAAGAKGPSPEADLLLKSPTNGESGEAVLRHWEKFLNSHKPKMVTTARYLYEHLFLAHIAFDEIPGDFYSLVRSSTAYPSPIDEIPTVKPYDNPGKPFYYRFSKIHSSIVFKTHIVYRFNKNRMERYKELFLKPDWNGENVVVPSYDPDDSANPFKTFQQIPARSRYQFLLDDTYYTVMTFIRGPVCKGQVALNVVNDHFWIMFLDPDADPTIKEPNFLDANIKNLQMPIKARGRFDRLLYIPYRNARDHYLENRTEVSRKLYPDGLGLDQIWAGDTADSQPFLTVYRHFDSASVELGAVGGIPRTGWVIDYAQFERIYYNLVAGFNVFSNVKEQAGIRLYMDLLRQEAELLFVDFLPPEVRVDTWESWYPTIFSWLAVFKDTATIDTKTPTKVKFQKKFKDPAKYKKDLFLQVIKRLRKDIAVELDPLNFHGADIDRSPAAKIRTEEELDHEFRKITHTAGGFASAMPRKGDAAFVRIVRENEEDLIYTVILNRYHKDVAFIEGEDLRLDRSKDTIHVVKGFIGCYPNAFFEVKFAELPEFFKLLRASDEDSDSFYNFFDRFGIKRSDPRFWEISDYFNDQFRKNHILTSGIFDLNRYTNNPKVPDIWDQFIFNWHKLTGL